MIPQSVTTHRLALVLVWSLLAAAAHGQSTTERPQELAIRDNQGKLVTVPPGDPAKPVDYIRWLDQTMSQGITDNAADAYAEAYKLYNAAKLEDEDLDKALAGPWKDLPTISAWLEANQLCLEKFRAATRKPQCYFPLRRPAGASQERTATASAHLAQSQLLIFALGPELATHRMICKALAAEGWDSSRADRENRSMENAATMLRTAQHLEAQATTIDFLVALPCAVRAYDLLRTSLAAAQDPHNYATRALSVLEAGIDPPLDISRQRGLLVESIALRDACQRAFRPGREAGKWEVADETMKELFDPAGESTNVPLQAILKQRLADIGYEGTVRDADAITSQFRKWLARPWPEAAHARAGFDSTARDHRNPLIQLLVPTLTRARELGERRNAYRRATHLILQLYVHHGRHGSFPAQLDDLQILDLKELRIDPFSGRDFGYQVKGEGFVLYSVAENRKDDGGRHGKSWAEDDFVFWPVQPNAR